MSMGKQDMDELLSKQRVLPNQSCLLQEILAHGFTDPFA